MTNNDLAVKIARFLSENQATTDQRINEIFENARVMIREGRVPSRQPPIYREGVGWIQAP